MRAEKLQNALHRQANLALWLDEPGVVFGCAGLAAAERIGAWPEVVKCSALTGDMDCLLHEVAQDMAHYSRFVMDTLRIHPCAHDCKTSLVLDRVKNTTALPP